MGAGDQVERAQFRFPPRGLPQEDDQLDAVVGAAAANVLEAVRLDRVGPQGVDESCDVAVFAEPWAAMG